MANVVKFGSGGVPAGNYTLRFTGTEEVPPNEKLGYPAGKRWKFTVTDGPQVGQTTSRITTSDATARNACGKFLVAMLGHLPKEGDNVDLDQFVGKKFSAVVQAATPGGPTRVEVIIAL